MNDSLCRVNDGAGGIVHQNEAANPNLRYTRFFIPVYLLRENSGRKQGAPTFSCNDFTKRQDLKMQLGLQATIFLVFKRKSA